MLPELEKIMREENVDQYAVLPFSALRVTYPGLLERTVPEPESVLVFLIPYFSGNGGKGRNVSLYAVPRDYHLYVKGLSDRLLPLLRERYPGHGFALFADHSPFDERHAAAAAGLGVIGDNGLLLNRKYGSYVFIAELVSDLTLGEGEAQAIGECIHCRACFAACPTDRRATGECLSAITQKKGDLTAREVRLLRENGTVWGCDRCQTECPYNRGAAETPIAFFREEKISRLTGELIDSMSEEAFSERAYAWRKRKTVRRNLKVTEGS